MAGIRRGAVAAGGKQQVAGLDLGQRDDRAVLLPLVSGAGDVDAGGGVGGVDQARAVIGVRAGRPPLVRLAELSHGERDRGGDGRAAALGGVLSGPGHDLADVPVGMVVGEDGLLDAGRAAAAGAAGAQHGGGGVDGVGWVVGDSAAGRGRWRRRRRWREGTASVPRRRRSCDRSARRARSTGRCWTRPCRCPRALTTAGRGRSAQHPCTTRGSPRGCLLSRARWGRRPGRPGWPPSRRSGRGRR